LHLADGQGRIAFAYDLTSCAARQIGRQQRNTRHVGERNQRLVKRPVPTTHQRRKILAGKTRLVDRCLLIDVKLLHQQRRSCAGGKTVLQHPALQAMVFPIVMRLAEQKRFRLRCTAHQFGVVDELLRRDIPEPPGQGMLSVAQGSGRNVRATCNQQQGKESTQ
jgi:hypothetical protein